MDFIVVFFVFMLLLCNNNNNNNNNKGCNKGQHAMELVLEIGRRLTEVSHEPRSALFLRQRLTVAVQRGNASCIIGTLKIDHLGK